MQILSAFKNLESLFLRKIHSIHFLHILLKGFTIEMLYIKGYTMLRCASENALFFSMNYMYLYQIFLDLSICKFNHAYAYKILYPFVLVNHPRPKIPQNLENFILFFLQLIFLFTVHQNHTPLLSSHSHPYKFLSQLPPLFLLRKRRAPLR